jgi:hypothetical protein
MRWWKDPTWIGAIGTVVLIVLTVALIILTTLLIPDDRWNSFLHRWEVTMYSAIPVLVLLTVLAIYNFKVAVRKTSQFEAQKIAARLDELFQRGQWLQGKVPTVGNAGEVIFCQFWAEETRIWSARMSTLLWENYGEDVGRDFNSNVGLNQQEPVGNTHPEAAAAYRALVHQLRAFQNIRRTLKF